jgi:precorrin-6A/cobalt-precorrin-6A reductase
MIFVLGGTVEARIIVERIAADSVPVRLHTLTPYGASLADAYAQSGALNLQELEKNIATAWAVIDATHPFAVNISQQAIEAAQKQNKKYLRYERPETRSQKPHVYHAPSHEKAAELACELSASGNILLTVGSRSLKIYKDVATKHRKKITARILPAEDSLRATLEAGFSPSEILALQGPVTLSLERAFLSFLNADVLVTKDSGSEGGTNIKIEAAEIENAKVVLVERPKLLYPWQTSSLEELLHEVHHIVKTRG